MNSNAKIGLFGTGLDTYWGQFDGLLDELKGYQARIRDRMERDAGVQVADAGMVDSPARALEAASLFAREQVDLVFLYMATYCLSSTILPVVQRLNCPVVVLNLQPTPAIDYERLNALGDRGRMTGMWLANCQACSAPEIASVLARSHRRCAFVTGWLDDPVAWRQIGEWIAAAGVCAGMRRNRLGVLGHYYGGMLDVYTDLTRQSAVFGTHVELLEMCELQRPARAGDRRGGRGQDRGVPRGFRGVARMRAGGAGACGAHVGGPRPLGGGARAGGDGLLLRGCSGQRLRADRHLRDRRQYAAHRDGESPWRASAR